jgi:hypothetical protein
MYQLYVMETYGIATVKLISLGLVSSSVLDIMNIVNEHSAASINSLLTLPVK